MKKIICLVLVGLAFVKIAMRDYLRYLLCFIGSDTIQGNINWLFNGLEEFSNRLIYEKNTDPYDLSMQYLDHLYDQCY